MGGIEEMGEWWGGEGWIGFWCLPPLEVGMVLAVVLLRPPRRVRMVVVFMLLVVGFVKLALLLYC